MRFDLTDLELFVAVAEAGSITHGAEHAHLALASASARIRGMEHALGAPLLERGRRGVALTPAGRALLHHARIVLGQMERMRGDLSDYADGFKTHIRLLSNTAALSEYLPEALRGFLAAHPNVDIGIDELPSHDIVHAIAADKADLGIVTDAVDLAALETYPFRSDHLVLVTATDHPLADRGDVRFREILEYPFVGLGDGSALQEHIAEHAARLGRQPAYRVRLRSFDAVCRMAEADIGVGIVPEHAACRCRRSMTICYQRLNEPWAIRHLRICVRHLDQLSPQARLLINHLTGTGETATPRTTDPS